MPLIDNQMLDARFSSTSLPRLPDKRSAVLRRAAMLPPADRALVETALVGGLSRKQIARLLGLPPGTVSRRLQRLGNRLHDPIVAALADERCPLEQQQREIGIAYFLHGRSARSIARARGMSVHEVQRTIEFIRGWHRGLLARAARV